MSIKNAVSKIAAERDQIEAHLEQLSDVVSLPPNVVSKGNSDVNSFLMSVIDSEFVNAAARLNAMGSGAKRDPMPATGDMAADKTIDVTEYQEMPDESS